MRAGPSATRVGLGLLVLAGLLTVGLVGLDAIRWSRAPALTVAAPVTVQSLLEEGAQRRHTLYAALRTEAPGARILLDQDEPGEVSTLLLTTLGAAGRVERVPFPDGWLPDGVPDASGPLRDSGWELHREPGPLDTVLIGSRDGRTVLVDRRSVPDGELRELAAAVPLPLPVAYRSTSPTMTRAIATESAILVALMLLGGLLLPRGAVPLAARPAAAFLAGLAVHALAGYVFLLGSGALLVGVLVAGVIGRSLRQRGHRPGWRRSDVPFLGGAVALMVLTVSAVRAVGAVIVHADAVDLIARAMAMAAGDLGLADLDDKRPLTGPALQALGHAAGIEGLQALSWAILIATVSLIVLLPRTLSSSRPAVVVLAGLLGVALLTNPMMATVGSLVSTNALVGALVVLLATLWARGSDGSDVPGVAPVVAVCLLALIPTRAESILVVGPVLLATLADGRGPLRWRSAWPTVGLGLLVWNGLHVLAAVVQGGRPAFPVTMLAGAGLLVLALAPGLPHLPPQVRGGLPWAAVGLLWVATLALAVTPLGASNSVLEGIRVNIGEGAGAWGVLAPTLAAVTVLALVVQSRIDDRRLALPFWVLIAAFPGTVLAKAADGIGAVAFDDLEATVSIVLGGGARVGSWGDSVNRMWAHFVPVAVALVVLVVVAVLDRPARPRGRLGRGGVVAAGVGALALWPILSAWSPTYLGPVAPGIVRVVEERAVGPSALELVDGVGTGSSLRVGPVALPEDATDVATCVTHRFTDLGRVSWGTVRLELEGPAGRTEERFGEMAWSGARTRLMCVPTPTVDRAVVELTASVSGEGRARPGSAAGVLLAADGGPVARVEVHAVSRSEDPRSPALWLLSRIVRSTMRAGPTAVTVLSALGFASLLLRRPEDAVPVR